MAEHVTDDGVRLSVEIEGRDGAPTVVLVHGLAASVAIAWRATGALDRLTGAGLRVVAYDARGHGQSAKPHEPERYGDDRVGADLAEIVGTYAGSTAVVAGYSMGASTTLIALTNGLNIAAAVVGGTPRAVLDWTEADETQRTAAVAVLEGTQAPGPAMQWWVDFLRATGADQLALAAFLRRHQPVISNWERIRVPTVVAAGADDFGAVPPADLAARIAGAEALVLAGDHVAAGASPAFTDAIISAATG